MSTTNPRFVRDYCDMALVLYRGRLIPVSNIEDALTASEYIQNTAAAAAAARPESPEMGQEQQE